MTWRVLVADDSREIRRVVRKVLEIKGCEVDEAVDGLDALTMIMSKRYDLVFLDIIMPHLCGDEVLKRMSPLMKERTPVVMLTGEDDDRSVMSGYHVGATYYITKPFRSRQISDILEYLIGQPDPQRRESLEARL